MLKLSLFFILLATLQAGEVPLPREAQRELDAFAAAVEKADNARAVAVNAAVDKAVKALNAAAQKAKTAEERRAIDDEILRISKQKVEAELLGDKKDNPWVGRYIDDHGRAWGELLADGTACQRTRTFPKLANPNSPESGSRMLVWRRSLLG